MRVHVEEYERFPSLNLDDGQWMEPENLAEIERLQPGYFIEVSDALVERLARARVELLAAEDAVREAIGWSRTRLHRDGTPLRGAEG